MASRPRTLPLARLLGRRIASLRAEAGLTQEKLAWEAGLEAKGYLSRIESGRASLAVIVVTLVRVLRDFLGLAGSGA